MQQALEARMKVINSRPVEVIEATPVEAPRVDEVPDHSMIIPPLSRRGFSKRRF
jgi:hypothetical protein